MTTERAPAYAGHQEHSCPVCLNVHGGAAEPAPLDADLLHRAHEPEPGLGNYATWRWDCSCGWHDNDADAQKWWSHVLAAGDKGSDR